MNKRTYVGLDLHTRSAKGRAIDRETAGILSQGLAPSDDPDRGLTGRVGGSGPGCR